MKLEIEFTAADIKKADIGDKVLVAFDVFRATSTIITALENGCIAVVPVCSVDEAWTKSRELKSMGRQVLVGGELHGIRVPGMDLGNSPMEYLEADLAGKILVLSTRNGTHAIRNAQGASGILIGSLLNAKAVALRLIQDRRDVVLGCAGRLGEFSLEDYTAAGAVAFYIMEAVADVQAADAVLAAAACFLTYKNDLVTFLRRGKHGRYLEEIGFTKDIDYCSQLNLYPMVPELLGDRITVK